MYILPADTKDCSSSVLSSLCLPVTFESKQLFLVIIGSGKRSMKAFNYFNENHSTNNITYNPIMLQHSIHLQDQQSMKNKDPRLNKNMTKNEILSCSTPDSIQNKPVIVSS